MSAGKPRLGPGVRTGRAWSPDTRLSRPPAGGVGTTAWSAPRTGRACDPEESRVPDQRFIALSCRGHGTHVWDTARSELLAELPSVSPVEGDYSSALPALTATGDRAAIARGNTVEVYALPSGQ